MKEAPATEVEKWEVRPCGMLVQKRYLDSGDAPVARIPTIRVKVKHGGASHEIYISSQATFGELKKALSVRTGIHHLDQKLMYKDKERDSAAFLDTVGVKDKSKLVLVEDPVAQAKRLLELRKTEKMEKAAKLVSAISLDVDNHASKVSALEAIVKKGGRVVETDVVNLIELLMNELVKLDGIVADGDVKLQKSMQVKRVQKYVETLDVIKMKNSVLVQPKTNGQINKNKTQENQKSIHKPQQEQQKYNQQQQKQHQTQQVQMQYQQHNKEQAQKHFEPQQPQQQAVTQKTDWDILDSLFMSSTTIQTPSTTVASTPTTRFDWELF